MVDEEIRWNLHPAAVILSLAAVFVLDLMIGSDVIVAIAYVGTVLACLWCNRRHGAIVTASGATVFTVLAAILSNAPGLRGPVLANLVLAILAIWASVARASGSGTAHRIGFAVHSALARTATYATSAFAGSSCPPTPRSTWS